MAAHPQIPRHNRRVLIAVAFGLVVSSISAIVLADEVTAPGAGSVEIPVGASAASNFGFGTGIISDAVSTWDLVNSGLGLGDVNPFTGMLGVGDAGDPGGMALAAQSALVDNSMLAFDASALAEQARVMYEQKRAKAAGKVAVERISEVGIPTDAELEHFSECGNPNNAKYQDRPEVVLAFEQMCRAAEADGVHLRIISGFRSVAHQADLFEARVQQEMNDGYDRAEAETRARKWVAPPGSSQHNRGLAIDVDVSDASARDWLHTEVGCYTPPDSVAIGVSCDGTGQRIERVQLYGFLFPMSWEAWHIELGVRIDGSHTNSSCTPPDSYTIPEKIAAIWRCQLDEAGYTPAQVDKTVAEALVVSRCESGWDPTAVVYGGQYVNEPNPETGMFYSAAGVFQFIKDSAEIWIVGGYANVTDADANIDAAVRYWMAGDANGDGWAPWECRSQLPQYGGSALPAWSYQY